ncbi:DUF3089 domain-containing protein [Aurantiacibacter arachoides]|uniref:DUF3089 domain-containing protein n=1 Tax=Aurantiacibacter arachoides TaxID=1850444 RepID=UPI0019AC90CB|nr:DUF3089 domain-containing protein [Aurantiacibacter arachoides]GGD46777.1 hypothetical protein GCM10011411_03110 [Aurantiacibacter arachoides]
MPDTEFVEQDPLEQNAYQDPDMWFSRPGKGVANDPARWQPALADAEDAETPMASASAMPLAPGTVGSTAGPATGLPAEAPASGEPPRFAVFFVHPTSFYDSRAWNASLADTDSQARARLMVRGMASAFNQASEIWVPRYRQATFGAFITVDPAGTQAIDAAYRDIAQAFDFFIDSVPADMPIVLVGHSQGAYHVTRLLQDKVAGTPLQARVAMAYPIGWPISIEHDLPSLGLPGCATPDQAGCVFSYASFAEPAEPGQFLRRYAELPGMDGQARGESPILCVNPITGTLNGTATAASNLGTLVPDDELTTGELVTSAVGARCADNGLLLIGDPPDLGRYVLPGNNYHVYDIPLFWANLQADVARRVRAWAGTTATTGQGPSPRS